MPPRKAIAIKKSTPAKAPAIEGIKRPVFKRIAKTCTSLRVSDSILDESRDALREFLEKLIHNTIEITMDAGRKTVHEEDVEKAFELVSLTQLRFDFQ